MLKKISRKTALIECMKHWEWIYKNKDPYISKFDYALPNEVLETSSCWCCYYKNFGLHKQKSSCKICPLIDIAWKGHCCNNFKNNTIYLDGYKDEPWQDVGYRLMWACYVALNEKWPSEYPLDFSEYSHE